MNLQEIREKYPQYNDLSDEQLVGGLHKKYYSDMPIEDFHSRIGYSAKPVEAPKQQARVAGEDEGDFFRGITNIPGQIQNIYGAGKVLTGLVANKLGATDTGKELIKSGTESMDAGEAKQVVKESDDFVKAWEKGIGTVVTDYIPYQIGSSVGNIAETLAFMGIGAATANAPGAIASVLGKSMVKAGIKEAAEKVLKEEGKEAATKFISEQAKRTLMGVTAGKVAQAGMHGAGEVTGRAVEEAQQRGQKVEDVELSRVLPAAAVHAVADFFVNKIGIDALKIGEKATNSLILDVGKRIAVTGTKELPAEEIQTLAERYGANLSLADADALKEYVSTAAASYAMSIAPGAVGGARTNLSNKIATDIKNKADADRKVSDTGTDNIIKENVTQHDADTQSRLNNILGGGNETFGADEIAGTAVPTDTGGTKTKEEADAANLTKQDLEAKKTTDAVEEAKKHLADIDDPNTKTGLNGIALNKYLTALGIPKATGKGSAAINRKKLEDYIAQGETSVAGSQQQPAGTSTELAAQPNQEAATTGTPAVKSNGVDVTNTTIAHPAGGKTEQPVALAQAPKTIEDLSPEMQAEVQRRQDEIAQIETEGGDATKQKGFLNKFLQKQGVTGTLSAKKSIEKDFLETGELPYAVEGKEKTDQELEAERVKAYEESLGKTIPDYELSEEDKRLYDETREEVNSQVDEANAKRIELAKELEDALKAFDEASEKDEEAASERLVAAEKALKEHGPTQRKLPEQKKFSPDYKDIYFGNISAGPIKNGRLTFGSSKREHRQAAKALQEYLQKTGGYQRENDAQLRRIINHYEENRAAFNKIFGKAGVTFPRWNDLTQEQKNTFSREMINNSGQQQNVAFAKLGVKIIEDSRQLSEGEKRERQNAVERQEQVRQESEAQQEKDKKTREAYERNKPTASSLPNNVIQMVMNNDLNGILEYMSTVKTTVLTSPYKRIMKSVAGALKDLKLNTKIRIVEASEINGDLAQYDPVSDTILVTREGLSSNTILHEIIHAGTVKVINEYLYGNKNSLSMGQLNAIKVLEKIMNETRDSLAEDHPEAYKSLFEFVSYALTSDQLQQDLHDQSFVYPETKGLFSYFGLPREDIQTILPKTKSAWSAFKLAIARIIKTRDTYLHKGKLNEKVDPNFLMEINAAFEDILSKPTEPIYLPALPAKEEGTPSKAEGMPKIDLYSKNDGYETDQDDKPKSLSYLSKIFTTAPGIRRIASIFQNDRYAIKYWEDINQLAEKIYHEGIDKINNIYTQITLAASSARNLYNQYIAEKAERLNSDIAEFAKAADLSTDEALALLHKVSEAMHEPERRIVKYLLTVPLRKDAKTGETMSPADLRQEMMSLLDTKTLDKAAAVKLKQKLEDVVFAKDAAGNFILDQNGYRTPNMANVDPKGYSPRADEDMRKRLAIKGITDIPVNLDADTYRVTVIEKDIAKTIIDQYNNHPQQAMIKQVLDSVQQLHKATTELNKMANYWSQPVSNRVNFYGFENYIPLKGYSNTKTDEMLSFDTMRRGKELQDMEFMFGGRATISKNPILQTMSDATRSAMRAGRKDLTQSIKNAIEQGLLAGKVGKKIPFEARQDPNVIKELPRENTVFHYNEDGSIQVLQIFDKKQREAIRRTYQNSKPVVELANSLTSALGTLHTRYNYSFAPMNFVRDAMTNAFAIGADMGPAESARFIKAISGQVLKGGMYKSMQVAILYQQGDPKSKAKLKEMADKDPYIKDMVEFVEKGGMVSYLGALSLKSNFQALHKEIGKHGIIKSKEQLDKFVDIWTDMFELASRSAAYGIAKKNFEGKGMTSNAASTRAAAYAKNLANFEQVGELGKAMGAFYMFFRPAATGAVRAIESLAPAWPGSLERALDGLPPEIKKDEQAKATFEKNYAEKQKHARIMTGGLVGLGMMAYFMSAMMSDDDELGRNAVLNDNMQQWTRYARFHIPQDITRAMGINVPVVFQIPWGFGLGAFAAAGAQMASVAAGKASVKDAMSNIFLQISLDSFIPIPVSKMPPTEMPLEFFLDSIAPSVARPILEFALNKNGLGQDIYNDQNRRFGDAYTGGDRIPEIYKEAARAMANNTLGGIDISPNTLYFLSNSYLDGIGRVFEAGYGISDLTQGRKGFDPKTDLPLMGSFFGAKSNVDSREFSAVEKQIQEMERKVKMFDTDPVQSARYLAAHPMDEIIVEMYNQQVNGELKQLRSQAKQYRQMQGLDPKTRDAMIKIITFQENLVKHNMIEQFKAYGIKP